MGGQKKAGRQKRWNSTAAQDAKWQQSREFKNAVELACAPLRQQIDLLEGAARLTREILAEKDARLEKMHHALVSASHLAADLVNRHVTGMTATVRVNAHDVAVVRRFCDHSPDGCSPPCPCDPGCYCKGRTCPL